MFAKYSDSIIAPIQSRKTGRDIIDSSIASNLKLSAVIVFVAVMFWLLFPKAFYQLQADAPSATVATTNGFSYLMATTLANKGAQLWGTNPDNGNDSITIINVVSGAPTVLAGEVFSLLLNRG